MALRDQVGADERAPQIDLDAYRRGLMTYVSVLTLQLQAMQARRQLAQATLAECADGVKLYKARGGGWRNAPGDANLGPARAPAPAATPAQAAATPPAKP